MLIAILSLPLLAKAQLADNQLPVWENMQIIGEPQLGISAWPSMLRDLIEAGHINGNITINLNYKQQGISNNDTWSTNAGSLKRYRLTTSHPYHYQFYLMPYSSDHPMNMLSRKQLPM